MMHATPLIVLTLLQLCRAEISEIIPGTWFSANAISDGYSPKPIMEIFSTEPTPGFSPTQPIVVLPSHSSQQDQEVTHLSTTSSEYPSSNSHSPTTTPQTPYDSNTYESSTSFPSAPSSFPTSSYYPPSNSFSQDGNSVTTVFPPPENFPIFNFPTSPQLPSNSQQTTISDQSGEKPQTTYDVVEPNTVSTIAPFFLPETGTPSPPYLLIYQNPPQIFSTNTQQSFTETSSTAPMLFPSSTKKPTTPEDVITPFITNAYSDGTSKPTVTFRSTPPTVSSFTTPKSTLLSVSTLSSSPCDSTINVNSGSTAMPPWIVPGAPKGPFSPKLKIRIVAPKGSITNVKINPSTTTKRPPTRKMKVKKLKNTHETCVDHCRGKREPICGVPLGTVIVEPKLLKGFPSICHMACHNSFKKEPYEKIVDGRCGKIRTRIIRIDANAKVHKEELKKSEYSIINTGPQAVVELAGSHVYEDKKRKH